MGPVWEANHVWLIFVLVILFTCFPRGYAALVTALFVPMHLVLAGIVLRGAAFVFRGYGKRSGEATKRRSDEGKALENSPELPEIHFNFWGAIFGAASVVSPMLLGASFGAITSGDVRVAADGGVSFTRAFHWLMPYPIVCGLLALSTCAYLAAVYLMMETTGELREDFRRRAIVAGTSTAGLAVATLLVARHEAAWFVGRLFEPPAVFVVSAGAIAFIGSAVAVFGRRYRLARVLGAGQTVLMLLGWGLAHREYLIYPDVKLLEARGAVETIRFVLWSLPVGLAMLVPSLVLLFAVFKRKALSAGPD